jgi:hypothetical protein
MVVTAASHRSAILPRKQVYRAVVMRGTRGNHVSIDGWYTVFDLHRSYDLIVRKNWMSVNPHTIDHSTNTLHLLEEGWLSSEKGGQSVMRGKSIIRLRRN